MLVPKFESNRAVARSVAKGIEILTEFILVQPLHATVYNNTSRQRNIYKWNRGRWSLRQRLLQSKALNPASCTHFHHICFQTDYYTFNHGVLARQYHWLVLGKLARFKIIVPVEWFHCLLQTVSNNVPTLYGAHFYSSTFLKLSVKFSKYSC